MSGSSLGLSLLWFVVILVAIPVVLWLVRRTPYGAAMGGVAQGVTRPIASMPIGPQQRIVTIEVGQGEERRWLVLGVTAQAITPLHTLSPQGDPPAAAAAEAPFAALFKKVRDARR
jgi:flagellar protein FliO/FliZ